MEDALSRFWDELTGRGVGPLHLRLIIQPVLAAMLALRAGWRDAQDHNPIFFLAIVGDPQKRRQLLINGWSDVGKVFITACLFDVIYQWIAFPWIRPVQVLIIATTLAIIPYLSVRGMTNRMVTGFKATTPEK